MEAGNVMTRGILLVLLAVASSNAAADWIMASESAAAVVYVDPATILRTDNRVTLLELTDYRAVPDPGHPYQSAKRSYQFDCVEGALRTLSIVTFAGKMGGGGIVLVINEPTPWLLFVPGSVGEILWRIACSRKSGSISSPVSPARSGVA
jgi:hypothetical protein